MTFRLQEDGLAVKCIRLNAAVPVSFKNNCYQSGDSILEFSVGGISEQLIKEKSDYYQPVTKIIYVRSFFLRFLFIADTSYSTVSECHDCERA